MKNEKAAEIFRSFLKRGKNRITPERFEVLDAALNHNGHFGADDLYIQLKNVKSKVSRAISVQYIRASCSVRSFK